MGVFSSDMIGVIGMTVRSIDGDKIGKVVNLHLDDQTGDPEWMEVSTGKLIHKAAVLPVAAASRDADGVVVPFGRKKVKDAPPVGDAKFITPAEESLLYTYYGVSFADAPSDPRNLVPGHPHAATPARRTAVSPAPSAWKPADRRPLSELSKDELYQRAKEADVPGRSKMTKQQLVEALGAGTGIPGAALPEGMAEAVEGVGRGPLL